MPIWHLDQKYLNHKYSNFALAKVRLKRELFGEFQKHSPGSFFKEFVLKHFTKLRGKQLRCSFF